MDERAISDDAVLRLHDLGGRPTFVDGPCGARLLKHHVSASADESVTA